MKTSLYEYREYKTCVVDMIEAAGEKSRGKRKELADAIGCQVSHITNVLSGNGHFNQEQAEACARFFGLTPAEIEFFLLLVQFNRAGTRALADVYRRMLDERQEKHAALKSRLKMPDSLREKEESVYYSSWQYGAVHVLLSIPQYQTRETIAEKLELPLSRVGAILEFLEETGLCRKEGARYVPARPLIHLDRASPLIARHHTNWRLRSIIDLDEPRDENLHYSGVFTLAHEDIPRVREILTKALAEALKVITASPEETAAVMCLDLFGL